MTQNKNIMSYKNKSGMLWQGILNLINSYTLFSDQVIADYQSSRYLDLMLVAHMLVQS